MVFKCKKDYFINQHHHFKKDIFYLLHRILTKSSTGKKFYVMNGENGIRISFKENVDDTFNGILSEYFYTTQELRKLKISKLLKKED